jgi:cysteine desulfurase
MGAAMALRNDYYAQHAEDCREKRKELIRVLSDVSPTCIVNGPRQKFAPHIVSASFPGLNGELLLFHLNQKGVAVSMGSACTSSSIEPSHVLLAMGLTEDQIEETLRISIGWQTTLDEIHMFGEILSEVLPRAVR